MFTGLIEEVARVKATRVTEHGRHLQVCAPTVSADTQVGQSVAVNGCCLTIAAQYRDELRFDILNETAARTNLGSIRSGRPVNLERAVPINGRLGGHFVQGHVDCTAAVSHIGSRASDRRLEIELPSDYARYVVEKGSVAVNGVSLTVAAVNQRTFACWIIPHTWEQTNLASLATGDLVNIEFDILAKYVERLFPPLVS